MTRGHDSTGRSEGGRHRRGHAPARTLPWRPGHRVSGGDPADADTDVIPVVTDHFPEAPATGLGKFNLGTIPASVTPPPTWRTAAWFSVAASALVLAGLTYAAAALVTGPRRPDVVDALPGLPTAANMFTGQPETPSDRPEASAAPTTTTRPSPTPSPSTSAATDRTPAPIPALGQSGAPLPVPSVVPAPGLSTPPTAIQPPVSPTRTTVSTPALVPPGTDTQAMGDRTETYYRLVVDDPAAAYAMTSGQLYREGADSIERRYAGVRRVEVQRITIDANEATTRSTLRLVRDDGTVTTLERELTFTYGSNPKISADSGAS